MTRFQRFIGGITVTYTTLVIVAIAGLWLTPFILNVLGQREFGLWLIAAQLTSYVALLDLGVVVLLPREVAYVTGRSGGLDSAASELSTVVGRTAHVVLLQLPLVVLAAVLVWWFLPGGWQEVRGPVSWLLVTFVVLFPFRIFPAILEGLQDLAFLGKVQLAAWTLGTTVTVLLLLGGWGLYSLVGGLIVTQFSASLAAIARVVLRFSSALPTGSVGWSWARSHRSIWLVLTDSILVGWLVYVV